MLPPSPLDESDDPAAAVDNSAHVDVEQLQWKRIVPVAPDGSSIIAPPLSPQMMKQLQQSQMVPVELDGSSIIGPPLSPPMMEQLQQSQMVPVEPDGSSIIGPTLSGSSIIGPKPVDPDAGPVSCTRDVMRWPTSNIKRLPDVDVALDTVCTAISKTTSLASVFSGVSAEHVSIGMCMAQLERMSNTTIKQPRYIAACDNDKECQYELRCLPHSPEHIYSDMKNFGSPELLDQLDMEQQPYCADRIAQMCMAPGAVTTSGKCVVCNKICEHERPDGYVAGIPCTDWTSWGKGRKLEGPTACVSMITLAFLALLLPFWILIENVPGFDENYVKRYLGRYYTITAVVLDNLDFGLAVRRVRKYILLTLDTTMTLTRPLSVITGMFGKQRDPQYSWRSLLSASDSELWSEILWSRSRTSSQPKPCDTELPPQEADFVDALLPTEQQRARDYLEVHDVDNCVVSLGQNPGFGRIASGEDILHTLVRSVHIQWIPSKGRWMTVREMLLAQSFPTTNDSLMAALGLDSTSDEPLGPLCSFNVSRPRAGLPARQRTAMAQQAGNTMCTSVCGSVLTWIFLYMKESAGQPIPPHVTLHTSQELQDEDDTQPNDTLVSLFSAMQSARANSNQSVSSATTIARSNSSQSLGLLSSYGSDCTSPDPVCS